MRAIPRACGPGLGFEWPLGPGMGFLIPKNLQNSVVNPKRVRVAVVWDWQRPEFRPSPSGMARRRTDPSRLEAFSDAVFALSATLLVVSMEVPVTFAELLSDLSGFVGFGISFGALVAIWSVHNAFFRRYGLQDARTVALNAGLLFIVLYYVFPLKFLTGGFATHVLRIGPQEGVPLASTLDELGGVFVLYGIGFTLVFLFFALLYGHASRCRETLELSAFEFAEARFLQRHFAIFAAVGLLSVAVATVGLGVAWGAPGHLYILLGPLCWAHGHWTYPKAEAEV